MKKWMGIFLAVGLIVLLVVRSVAGEEISKEADFGQICDDNGYFSQIARCDGKDYVIYSNQEQYQSALVTEVDKNLYQYQALATAHADRVYYLFSYMDEGEVNFAAEPVVLGEGEVWETPVFQAEGSLFAAGATEDEILVSILGKDKITITEYALPLYYEDFYEWEERVSFSLMEDHYVVCATYEEGELYLLQEDGKVFLQDFEIEEADMVEGEDMFSSCFKRGILEGAEGEWEVTCRNYAAEKYLPLVFMITVLFMFWLYGIRKENHLVYRLVCYGELIGILALVFVGRIVEEELIKHKVLENGIEAGYLLDEMKLYQNEDETMEVSTYLESVRRREDILEDLIIADPQSGEVILSKTLASGMNVYEYYGQEAQVLVEQVAQGNQAVMLYLEENGRNNYIVSTRNWSQIDAQSVLLAIMPKIGVLKSLDTLVSTMWNTIFMFVITVTVLHMLLFLLFSFRWKKFMAGMEFIAVHKKPGNELPKRNDGLYGAWAVLDRIGQNTLKLQYERENLYKKYYRFVPKGIEKLLGKNDISQITEGDSNKVAGCMVEICMENHHHPEEDDYKKNLMESMHLMQKIQKRYEAVLIDVDAKLINRKLFFPATPENAVLFATDLLLAHEGNIDLEKCCVSMVLQQAEYEYGVSGTEEMMIPFMYARTEEIPDAYKKLFMRANLDMVMTQETYDAVGNVTSARYIGYIRDEKKEKNIRLYEGLESYSKEKRTIMKDCDIIFQKAVSLFYGNEFYTARNLFHEVLKLNSEDEVARWYLLSCERFLNKENTEITYGLFDNLI